MLPCALLEFQSFFESFCPYFMMNINHGVNLVINIVSTVHQWLIFAVCSSVERGERHRFSKNSCGPNICKFNRIINCKYLFVAYSRYKQFPNNLYFFSFFRRCRVSRSDATIAHCTIPTILDFKVLSFLIRYSLA